MWPIANSPISPQQRNGFDCGVFVLTNIMHIIDDLPLNYPTCTVAMGEQRRRIALCLLQMFFRIKKVAYQVMFGILVLFPCCLSDNIDHMQCLSHKTHIQIFGALCARHEERPSGRFS